MISGRVHFSVIQRAADGMVLGHHKVTFKRGKGDTLESEGHEGAAAALAKHLNLEPGKRAGVWLKPEGWQMPEYR